MLYPVHVCTIVRANNNKGKINRPSMLARLHPVPLLVVQIVHVNKNGKDTVREPVAISIAPCTMPTVELTVIQPQNSWA